MLKWEWCQYAKADNENKQQQEVSERLKQWRERCEDRL